jgi:hypothetical protein
MVGTRSGIETNPIPATQEEDIPRQVEVTSTEQEGEPSPTNPDVPLQTLIRSPNTYIAGTDSRIPRAPGFRIVALGQSPEDIGDTLGASPTHKKSPSVPTDFRPAKFSFLPQPYFQSARKPSMNKEDEIMEMEDKVVQGYSARVPIFQAPKTPLDVARTSYLDYTKTQSISSTTKDLRNYQEISSMGRC